jgi:hypothetical protein
LASLLAYPDYLAGFTSSGIIVVYYYTVLDADPTILNFKNRHYFVGCFFFKALLFPWCEKYIKLKSKEELGLESLHVLLLSVAQVDVESEAEFHEPPLGGLERSGLAELNGKFSNLFFVS